MEHRITEEIVGGYLKHLAREEYAQDTVKKYLRDIRTFAAWLEKRADVEDCIRYIAQPVLKMEQLRKNVSGRYETGSGFYYCCGSPIEALVTDGRYDVPYWVRTSVEHDGTDYYLVGHREVHMEGLTVRIRRSS